MQKTSLERQDNMSPLKLKRKTLIIIQWTFVGMFLLSSVVSLATIKLFAINCLGFIGAAAFFAIGAIIINCIIDCQYPDITGHDSPQIASKSSEDNESSYDYGKDLLSCVTVATDERE
jgi:hypothetical protein